MSTYRDGPFVWRRGGWVPTFTWEYATRQRLAWLYGDADERIAKNEPDVAAWRNLGKRRAA